MAEDETEQEASNVVVQRERGGGPEALFPVSSILLNSRGAGWRGISAERLRLSLETPEHHHHEHFLTLQLGPPALMEVKEGKRYLRLQTAPGELTLIGADIPHQVRYEGADVLAVSLTPALVQRVAEETLPERKVRSLEFVSQNGVYDAQVERFGQLLKTELEAGAPTGSLFADAIGQALAAHLLRRYSTAATQREEQERGGLSSTQLRRALDFIEDHLERDFSLTEVAAEVGLSPFHFARQFRASIGLAPHAYLITRRVERAKELLSRTNLPIATVAATTGFAHQSHLTRHFKRLVGVTPARFR